MGDIQLLIQDIMNIIYAEYMQNIINCSKLTLSRKTYTIVIIYLNSTLWTLKSSWLWFIPGELSSMHTITKVNNPSKCAHIRDRKISCDVGSSLSFFYSPVFADTIIGMSFGKKRFISSRPQTFLLFSLALISHMLTQYSNRSNLVL